MMNPRRNITKEVPNVKTIISIVVLFFMSSLITFFSFTTHTASLALTSTVALSLVDQ